MIKGLYTAASGMNAQIHRMNQVSNNMANVDLTGYKKDIAVHKAFPEMLIRRFDDNGVRRFPLGSYDEAPLVGRLGSGVEMNEAYTIFSQGALKETGNPFDMALEDKGFFSIQTPDGERYTRNGSFHLGKEGLLVTKDGFPVMGENGPIQIKKHNFVIDKNGRVFFNAAFSDDPEEMVSLEENDWENMQFLDQLKVVQFNRDRFLKKEGNSLWRSTLESGEAQKPPLEKFPAVRQGFLESSNVNPVTEMVQMIEVNRAYEANQKVIQSHDQALGKLINDAARAV